MIRHTALYKAHLSLDAKMGEFAGYDMPLYYPLGVMKEHEWVRANAGLFDVSHMGQIILQGPDCAKFLERLTPSSFQNKPLGRSQYTVLTNDEGGIVDDLIITRVEDEKFFIVLNAGCKDKDIAWIKRHMPEDITLKHLEDRSLIAIQGPKAQSVLGEILDLDLSAMPYMSILRNINALDTIVHISRVGYTGEDGFEISVTNEKAENVWFTLMEHEAVKPIGLAARDSLRLEMGYCLYGHDINDQTTPIEADLTWIMGKENTGFIGADIVLAQKIKGAAVKRVGIRLLDKGVAREEAEIRNENDEKIGELCSGGYSPTLQASIGQGYVPMKYTQNGTKIFVNVRGRNIAAEVAPMPFVQPQTKTIKKKTA